MQLIEYNVLFFVVALILGIIPYKVHIRKKSSKRKGCSIEIEAYFWQFSFKDQHWYLRITGVYLLNQRMRDKLDR